MNEPTLIDQQNQLLGEMSTLAAARAGAVQAAAARSKATETAVQEEFEQATQRADADRLSAEQAENRQFEDARRQSHQNFEPQYRSGEQEYLSLRQRITSAYSSEKTKAKRQLNEARWETTTVFDATKHKPKREFLETEQQVNLRAQRLELIAGEAKALLFDCRMYREPRVDPAGTLDADQDPLKQFIDQLASGESLLLQLKGLSLPRLFSGGTFLWIFIGIWLVLVYPAGWATDWQLSWIALSGGLAVVLGTIVAVWLYAIAKRRMSRFYDPMCQALVNAEIARQLWHEQATAKYLREQAESKQRHDSELKRAAEMYDAAKSTSKERRDVELKTIEAKFPPRLASLKKQHDEQMAAIVEKHQLQLAEITTRGQQQARDAQENRDRRLAEAKSQYERDGQSIAEHWRQGLDRVRQKIEAVHAEVQRLCPDWDDPAWENWVPPKRVAPVIRIGKVEVGMDQILGSASEDPRVKSDLPSNFWLPALLSFPDRCSMLLKTGGAGRVKAVELLQATMLRFLTAIPPGKVRFTIIDPVGLGQNFAGFMHLADYDEALVNNKIWTEPPHIEQRLADLTAHMANVIQKYLRNEYETIEDYNEQAGEVAEPFRVVVVANFPFNFTEAATRHLVSIASTGARCGVFTLIGVDTKLPLPHGFRMADLEQQGVKLLWKEQGFVWKDEHLEKFPLKLDEPPPPERFRRIVHMAGEGAKDANRVEVPFEFIAPPRDQWWTNSAGRGIDVPLGRAGATKRQNLKLGRGTAQHVLIAGKTGSGKSTLLHALITNLALMYSPEEVELYLIDFKKGVEFKTYAIHELPHARVIAIESEREFGLSVLQRLDAELKFRGDKFRDLGVQDLNSYRESGATEPMPRILLIVDEFQEFFVEDDKIAQDVSLLLDRLVRQGRAFGIHIHLGSQTLGGAYSLARSTLGQMAVRIALQCSEADANLILSEENPAARLLSRPGEAIYNDANGRTEGNNLFQVVWLSDDGHERYLEEVRQLARDRKLEFPPQIVFEGSVPADVEKNMLLHQLLAAQAWPANVLAAQAWLGEAIAIKDPTAAVFRRQSGANVVMIGQQGEGALAQMAVMLVSLAAQHPAPAESAATGARFYFLDGSPADSPHAGFLPRLVSALPHPLELLTPRDTARVIDELATEVERRQASQETDAPPLYLFIYDIQRFRELRKQDDDFGFSRGGEKPSPIKQLGTVLREGPGLGVHTIVWGDTLNNLNRAFDRQAMREFETRILFQMSVADSSSLIDSPSASKLGVHRAFLHSEEQGRLEKFRPYSLPPAAWLAWVGEQLRRRQSIAVPSADPIPSEG
jgi:S-DNA-T family DNA segregation ATPase FtsK/SpoIIIE